MPSGPGGDNRPGVVLIHGAATTSTIWDSVAALVRAAGCEVLVPERLCSGDLDTEVASLASICRGRVVAGVGGGATMGLALLGAGVPIRAAHLHEPAVGSLAPGLLDHVVAGYRSAGVPGFGAALYGPRWRTDMAPTDPSAVQRDLAMFRSFEPVAWPPGTPVVVSTGQYSPPARHAAARALVEQSFSVELHTMSGVSHAAHLESPGEYANVLVAFLAALPADLPPA